jgi:hypothetical protein
MADFENDNGRYAGESIHRPFIPSLAFSDISPQTSPGMSRATAAPLLAMSPDPTASALAPVAAPQHAPTSVTVNASVSVTGMLHQEILLSRNPALNSKKKKKKDN